MAARYALYFVPGADSELYRFGATVIGYDTYTGGEIPFLDDAPEGWKTAVVEPRVYGFHATLKPPFYLADGLGEADLLAAASKFAAARPAVSVGSTGPRELGSFIALVPAVACPSLDQLAQDCVTSFDSFRAPMTEQERTRRLTPGLTDRQIENLVRWGYPYVFADFRFHMTLTGALALPKRNQALQFLNEKFEQLPQPSLTIDRIVVARQDERWSRFQVVATAFLG